ncbi:S10 family peptidase [Legionella lytica]|uniref:S10 family peptidase n=1 Tax=Legionella lytica TaxID=96232 RepID=A0ABW8DB39_9GAMM
MRIVFLLLFLGYTLLTFSSTPHFSDSFQNRVLSLPGFGTLKNIEYTGYLPISTCSKNKCKAEPGNLFYWYVENQAHNADAPLVLWLNGGPGAASMYGFFMENGPYVINKDGTLSERHYSWSQKANYLVIDQPAGVGFSYGDLHTFANEAEAMDQLYAALKVFFQQHPQLESNALYLAGESYAGKYLPQLAMRIIAEKGVTPKINLKGLLIGDPWVNPRVQQRANADFAYSHGLIDRQIRNQVLKLYDLCAKEIDKTAPSSRKANQVCTKMQELIEKESGGLNMANIAKGSEPEDTAMINYLNKPDVRKALHIDGRVPQFKNFSASVADQLEIGEQDSVADLYPKILAAGVPVLIYNGLEDGKDSNFMSTELWLSALQWPFKEAFAQAPSCVWHTDGQVAGYAKTAGGLTQVKIRNAGHLAPIDQPARVYDLFTRFISNKPLC